MNNEPLYYNTAKERQEAMAAGRAPEPRRVLISRAAERAPVPPPAPKYHWEGSNCVAYNMKNWHWKARDRVLTGDRFDKVPAENQCKTCLFDFENA